MADIEKTINDGERFLNDFDYKKAKAKFKAALKEDPKNARAHFGMAETLLALPESSVENVVEHYTQAVESDPGNVFYLTSLAAFNLETGRFNEAEQCYNKATELDEENAGMYFAEFAIGYAANAPIVMERFLDATTTKMIHKKALEYALKAINMSVDSAKELLQE